MPASDLTNNLADAVLPIAAAPVNQSGYVNKAIFLSAIVVLVIAFGLFLRRHKLIEWKRSAATFHYFTELGEWVLAIGISAYIAFFELAKQATWSDSKSSLVGSFTGLTAGIAIYLGLKGISAAAKKRDSYEIESLKQTKLDLEQQLAAANQSADEIRYQRDMVLEVTTYIRKIVDAKMKRVIQGIKSSKGTPQEVVAAMDPQGQVWVILKLVFVYFEKRKQGDEKIRLGIYGVDPNDKNFLRRKYNFNCVFESCYIECAVFIKKFK